MQYRFLLNKNKFIDILNLYRGVFDEQFWKKSKYVFSARDKSARKKT